MKKELLQTKENKLKKSLSFEKFSKGLRVKQLGKTFRLYISS